MPRCFNCKYWYSIERNYYGVPMGICEIENIEVPAIGYCIHHFDKEGGR